MPKIMLIFYLQVIFNCDCTENMSECEGVEDGKKRWHSVRGAASCINTTAFMGDIGTRESCFSVFFTGCAIGTVVWRSLPISRGRNNRVTPASTSRTPAMLLLYNSQKRDVIVRDQAWHKLVRHSRPHSLKLGKWSGQASIIDLCSLQL